MNSMTSTANITLTILIGPHLKNYGPLFGQKKLGATYANIATDDDSMSNFNTAVANLATQYTQDNATKGQLLETNQTMQNNLNTIIQ